GPGVGVQGGAGPGQAVLQPVREKDLRPDSFARAGARFSAHSPRPDQLWALLESGMNWTTHYFEPRLNRDCLSRAFSSKEDALRQACDLMQRKCRMRFVKGPSDEKIDAIAIVKWCKRHRTPLIPRRLVGRIRSC